MYSQCPKCQAIFSVSESDIGAHHGLVRCGYCSSIFHAVTNEVADARIPSGGGAPAQTGSSEPSPGEQVAADDSHVPSGGEAPGVIGGTESVPDDRLDTASHYAVDDAGAAVNDARGPGEHEPAPYPDAPGEREDPAAVPEDRKQPDEKWIEAVLSEPAAADDQASHDTGALPGEITEEITIEAPPVLWNVFDEELEAGAPDDASTGRDPAREHDAGPGGTAAGTAEPEPASGPAGTRQAARAPRPAEPEAGAAGQAPGRRTPLSSPYRARDVRMVELPQPRPFKTATLSLTALLLGLLLVWQAKTFYLDELAQLPALRPYLETLCGPLGCVLPPRSDFAQIDLVGTSIDVNPEIPGALEITASLINRAGFPQPYPPLRVTLSDREGRVVGRRTYLPSEYRQDEAQQAELLPVKEVRDVSIKLAQPAEDAVGYEVELITPIDSDG